MQEIFFNQLMVQSCKGGSLRVKNGFVIVLNVGCKRYYSNNEKQCSKGCEL